MVLSIDEIWNELKEEGEQSLKESKKNARLKSKFASKVSSKTISRRSNQMLNSNFKDNVDVFDSIETSGEIFDELVIDFEDSQQYSSSVVDSDDDTDYEEELNAGLVETKSMGRIGRIASAIKSRNLADRLIALERIYGVLFQLHEELPKYPDMDFPPPYHPTRIALTHNKNAMVSDLSSKSHSCLWSEYWEQTDNPLSKALENDVESKIEPKHKHIEDRFIPIQKKIQVILDGCGHALFMCICDGKERCRQLALKILTLLCPDALDIGKHIPYFMSALLSRFPPTHYDNEMHIFVDNIDSHSAFKRGVAIERQDKHGLLSLSNTVYVVEESEDIRLLMCRCISRLVRVFVAKGSLSVLSPYVADLIQALYTLLRDSFAHVKIEASLLLIQVFRIPQWESAAKVFALGMARAVLPNLRNRKSSIREVSLSLFESSVSVPNREKLRSAGSDAILDLIGFHEENVIPIGAFYDAKQGVTVNTLAEIVGDQNVNVRKRCCMMLSLFLVCLPDRYDYHVRLLPYMLSFFNDDNITIRRIAIEAIDKCGEQYEVEHADDIIERRQYGIDGDLHINLSDPLPEPFESRPRLGTRLFVRANTKRFYKILTKELSSWSCIVRERSLHLIKIIIIFNEEHLTVNFHETMTDITKAIVSAWRDNDDLPSVQNFVHGLLDLFGLMGRYVQPVTYVPLLIPRIIGDESDRPSFAEGGYHSDLSRAACTAALRALMEGSLGHMIVPHIQVLTDMFISDECSGHHVGKRIQLELIRAIDTFLRKICNLRSRAAESLYFEQDGCLVEIKTQLLRLEIMLVKLSGSNVPEVSSTASDLLEIIDEHVKSSITS